MERKGEQYVALLASVIESLRRVWTCDEDNMDALLGSIRALRALKKIILADLEESKKAADQKPVQAAERGGDDDERCVG